MKQLKFILDGQVVNSPQDWKGFVQEIDRNFDDRTISTTYENTITFTGDAHALIAEVYRTKGYCAEISFVVQEQCNGRWQVACRGIVLLSDAEWNETKCEVKVSVVDNGIGARVDNNKGIPVSPTAVRSKNGEAIAAVPVIPLVMFNPYTGADIVGERRAFDWFECVKQAIAYMTDGQVAVTSPWYNALPDAERYAIAYGNDLRVSGVEFSRFNYAWKDLFYEFAKAYNLWIFAGETIAGESFLRIDVEGAFYADVGTLEILNIEELIRKIDTDRLPASVSVGCDDEIRELQTGHSLPFVSMLGHSSEVFHFTGVCNTTDELDLSNKWITGNNAIESVVVDNNDDFDKDVFLIQYDRTTNKAVQSTYLNLGAAPYLYNEGLLNINVLERYDLPSPVGSNYSPENDNFRATATDLNNPYPQYIRLVSPALHDSQEYRIRFDDDYTPPNFDTNNNWGDGTTPGTPVSEADSIYTATVQGFYSFNLSVRWAIISSVPQKQGGGVLPYACLVGMRRISVIARVFSSLGVQVGPDQVFDSPIEVQPGMYTYTFNVGASLNTGDYIEFYYLMQSRGNVVPPPGSGFVCDASYPNGPGSVTMQLVAGSVVMTDFIAGGGFISPAETSRIELYELDRALPLQDWSGLVTNPENNIRIDGPRLVHFMNVKRNIATGRAEWQLIRRPPAIPNTP